MSWINQFLFEEQDEIDTYRVRIEFDLKNQKHVDVYQKVLAVLNEEGFIGDEVKKK